MKVDDKHIVATDKFSDLSECADTILSQF